MLRATLLDPKCPAFTRRKTVGIAHETVYPDTQTLTLPTFGFQAFVHQHQELLLFRCLLVPVTSGTGVLAKVFFSNIV